MLRIDDMAFFSYMTPFIPNLRTKREGSMVIMVHNVRKKVSHSLEFFRIFAHLPNMSDSSAAPRLDL
jgi:hypothetical protein